MGFGLGWGADIPFYSNRLGIVIANPFPESVVREILFEKRNHWLGGRKIGAIVDCSVFSNQDIAQHLIPIRDALVRENLGPITEVAGPVGEGSVPHPRCKIFFRGSAP